jgi:hypothetical protein
MLDVLVVWLIWIRTLPPDKARPNQPGITRECPAG